MYPGCFAPPRTWLTTLITITARRLAAILAILLLSIPAAQSATHPDWRPVAPEELTQKQSKIDPNADAEALFREVWIDRHATTNYLRLKIFNQRGREKYSDVKIEYLAKFQISGVSGRTIHADGTVIDLSKDSIFDQVEVKVKKGNLNVKVLSFALPSVEPGSIVEYRWTEDNGRRVSPYIPLDVQSDYPVREVTFHVKPAGSDRVIYPPMHFMRFGCEPQQSSPDSKGFTALTVLDVPAYHDEPFSPPERSSRQWILAYYDEEGYSLNDFWSTIGKEEYKQSKEEIRINGEIKEVAAAVVSNGKTDEERLSLLADYCRQTIKDVWSDDISTELREQFKPNKNSADTFHRKIGTPRDIDMTFIALAQAAGYKARLALVADRRSFLFNPKLHSSFFLNNYDAAVQINGKWKFYDVGDRWAPPGTLAWREQAVYALIPDATNSEWVQTPLLTPNETKIQRVADFTLSPEGDLDGDVRELYWGNESIGFREAHASQTDAERQEFVREKLKDAFSDFEVAQVLVTMSPDANLPVGIKYRLLVKGYAQRTGKRLFLHPSFFNAGRSAYFTSSERTNAIYFDYPWNESDVVTIHLPNGFELDHAESPASFDFPPSGQYAAKLFIQSATNTLTYQRSFTVAADQRLLLDPVQYAPLKAVFDRIHANDEHIVTLKATESQPATR